MTTRDDVLDAVHRIETAGGAGNTTRTAQAALTLPLPESGYDRVLRELQSAFPQILAPTVRLPEQEQQGRAAQAMKEAETALAQQLSAAAKFDRQIIEALRHAHKTTLEGRRRLENLESEIVGAARAWDLSTAAGAREFQRYLIAKLGEIIQVVEETNDDDASKRALATALTARYAAQAGSDDPPADRKPEPDAAATFKPGEPAPAATTDPDMEPNLDSLPADPLEPVYQQQRPAEAPVTPPLPGFGGAPGGFGAMPSAMPAGPLPTGLLSGLRDGDVPDDDAHLPDDVAPEGDASSDGAEGGPPDDHGTPELPQDDGPATVTLPDGATTTVTDPRLAAAMQAAADGTPVAEAFRRQGIDLPPAGTPVTESIDRSRLRPGDIGVFLDRHALAVGEGKALLDGQLHQVDNLRGPGFLGWQHPPVRSEEPAPAAGPAATRPARVRLGPKA